MQPQNIFLQIFHSRDSNKCFPCLWFISSNRHYDASAAAWLIDWLIVSWLPLDPWFSISSDPYPEWHHGTGWKYFIAYFITQFMCYIIITVAFIIRNLINPICLNSFTIKFEASEKNLTSWRDFCKLHPWRMWHKRSNSQFQMVNPRNWGIMGNNDAIVCVTVTKADESVLFIGLDRADLVD